MVKSSQVTPMQYGAPTVIEQPPSHQPRSHYVLQKLGGRSKNFVQRSRNAVETDMDVEDVIELWTC